MKKKSVTHGYTERWAYALVIMICIGAMYSALRGMNLIAFAISPSDSVGIVSILLIGIVASGSTCMALVGGLLLSASAVWAERTKDLSSWKRFDPFLYFNIGRLLGYALFGGLTGLLGAVLVLSITSTGVIKIVLAFVLIVLGLRILHLVPKKYCSFPLPRSLQKRMQNLAHSDHVFAPFFLGMATFFVPCGFTQSMQLLALTTGSFLSGATIMFLFALGTLPTLLGISIASASLEGKAAHAFFAFAGSLSLLLGIQSLHTGLLLTGIDLSKALPRTTTVSRNDDPNVSIDKNGQQIISVTVTDRGYNTSSFAIERGKPTWIAAYAPSNVSGCLASLVIPSMNIRKAIVAGTTWIGPFTPTADFSFICSQGIYKADVYVR